MSHTPQIKIPATYMRGGTSKGVFFRLQDLPASAQVPGAAGHGMCWASKPSWGNVIFGPVLGRGCGLTAGTATAQRARG